MQSSKKICSNVCVFPLPIIDPKKEKNNSFQLHNPQPESNNPQPESHHTSIRQKFRLLKPKRHKKGVTVKKFNETTRNPETHRGNNRTFSSTKSHRPSLATHNARSRLASCARTDGLQLKPLQQAEDENPSCLGKQGSLYH